MMCLPVTQLLFFGSSDDLEEGLPLAKQLSEQLAGRVICVSVNTDEKASENVVEFFGLAQMSKGITVMGFSVKDEQVQSLSSCLLLLLCLFPPHSFAPLSGKTRRILRETLGSAGAQAPCWVAGLSPALHRLSLQRQLTYWVLIWGASLLRSVLLLLLRWLAD